MKKTSRERYHTPVLESFRVSYQRPATAARLIELLREAGFSASRVGPLEVEVWIPPLTHDEREQFGVRNEDELMRKMSARAIADTDRAMQREFVAWRPGDDRRYRFRHTSLEGARKHARTHLGPNAEAAEASAARRDPRNARDPRRDLSASEVERLPVGTIVTIRSDFLVVVPDGLIPLFLLPERSGSHVPDGEPARQWGATGFTLVAEGRGRLPTHETGQKKVVDFTRAKRGERDLQRANRRVATSGPRSGSKRGASLKVNRKVSRR